MGKLWREGLYFYLTVGPQKNYLLFPVLIVSFLLTIAPQYLCIERPQATSSGQKRITVFLSFACIGQSCIHTSREDVSIIHKMNLIMSALIWL